MQRKSFRANERAASFALREFDLLIHISYTGPSFLLHQLEAQITVTLKRISVIHWIDRQQLYYPVSHRGLGVVTDIVRFSFRSVQYRPPLYEYNM